VPTAFILSIEKSANDIALVVAMPQALTNFNMSMCRMLSVPRYMPFLLGFSMAAAACSPAAAAVIATRSYSYFTIKGKTADQLDQQLSTNGPTASGSSARHPGATKIRFGGDATYVQTGGRCRVASAKVTVHTQIILPRWANRRGASKQLSMIWDALSSDIKRHEERHAAIARNQARVMEKQILALPPQGNCERMQELVTDVSTRGIEEHDRLQARFDRIEAVNFQNRMIRLLDNQMRTSGGAR
jgi:predicted secreted Zn-dependent protease